VRYRNRGIDLDSQGFGDKASKVTSRPSLAYLMSFPRHRRPTEIPVYHLTIHESRRITFGELIARCARVGKNYPYNWALWMPNGSMTMNKTKHGLKVFFFQWVPAYVIDFALFCLGRKRL